MGEFEQYKNMFSNYEQLELREQQKYALDFIGKSAYPIICLEAPCGMGKSLIGMITAAMNNGGTYIVQSKALQFQLARDFPETEVMWGRTNFACQVDKDKSCAECSSSKNKPCLKKAECLYEIKKKMVLASKYRVLNYNYAITEMNYVGRFSTPEGIIICDEADTLENILANFVNLTISSSILRSMNMSLPKKKTAGAKGAIESWVEWAELLGQKIKNKIALLHYKIKEEENKINGKPDVLIQSVNQLSGILEQIRMFSESVNKNWIMEIKENSYINAGASVSFKPVWISQELSQKYFFRHGNKFILMSATFPPREVLGKTLGRPPGDIDYLSLDSRFDKKNRMVYSVGCANLTSKEMDVELPKANDTINNILSGGFKVGETEYDTINTKGIIHTVSWKLNKFIVDNDTTGRILTHNSNNREQIIRDFLNSRENVVLASPSLTRGIDLKGDLARFVIWLKCPFLYLGDKLVSARCYSRPIGNMWFSSMAAQEIVQGVGRAMRSEDDYMVGILIDYQIQRLIVNNLKYFAKHFTSAIEIVQPNGWTTIKREE